MARWRGESWLHSHPGTLQLQIKARIAWGRDMIYQASITLESMTLVALAKKDILVIVQIVGF